MVEFDYKNFVPDDDLEKYAHAMLMRITEVAPYDSIQSADISREKDRYRVKLEIASHFGPFIAVATSTDCREALDKAESQIYSQLSDWKKQRFVSQGSEAAQIAREEVKKSA